MSSLTKCSKCGLQVKWLITAGRPRCVDPDGKDHWDTCSREKTRQMIARGTPFKDKAGRGVVVDGRKVYLETVHADPKKEIPPHPAGVLPWEEA